MPGLSNASGFNKNGFLTKKIEEWTESQNFKKNDSYNLCIRLNQFAQKNLYNLKIHKRDPQELLVSTLYIRSLSIFQGVVILLTKGMLTESKILLRSLLEILFRISVISQKYEYAIDFINQDQISRKKMINKFRMLSDNIKKLHVDSHLSEFYDNIKNDIDKRGVKEHGTQWYAQKAGLEDEYNTAYSLLCNSVHSNVRHLESYLILDKNDEVTSFKYGPTNEENSKLFLTNIDCMIKILNCINSLFELDMQEEINEFSVGLNNLVKIHL